MTRRHTDPPVLDVEELRKKRRRYEALRNLLAIIVVTAVLGLLVMSVVMLGELRGAVRATEELRADEIAAAAQDRAAEQRRTAASEERLRRLLTASQGQLDDMDARSLERLQLILDTIRAAHRVRSVPTLPPTPSRGTTPAPTPQVAPTPQPQPTPCVKTGKSQHCH